MAKSTKKPNFDRRSGRPQTLAESLRRLTRGPFAKQGFARQEIITRWPTIVGTLLAAKSCPERITRSRDALSGGTLQIRAESGFALELQHLAPQVIERINAYFGFAAIERLTIVQGPVPSAPVKKARTLRPISDEDAKAIKAATAGTRDPALAAALEGLGRALAQTTPADLERS
jgi:hypothetical protein